MMTGLKNWKLRELGDLVEVVAEDSIERRNELLVELALPHEHELTGLDRAETTIDWSRMPEHYQFFFDRHGWDEVITEALRRSRLRGSCKLVMTYGWKEPMIKVPTDVFIDEWQDLFQSAKYETIIFSEDYKLIMEVSRDYLLHSNFSIMPPPASADVAGSDLRPDRPS